MAATSSSVEKVTCVVHCAAIRTSCKLRGKAWQIAGREPAIDSVKVIGDDKDRLEMVGDRGVNWVKLVSRLGKKVGAAQIELPTTNCVIL